MALQPFYKASRPVARDLASIINRKPYGLSNEVRASYAEIRHPDSNIGLLGFQITQYGVRYEVRYKDDHDNDKLSFSVTVPNGQAYLRRQGAMGIAEKAHALMLVQEVMGNTKQWIATPLYDLQKACFDNSSGTVLRGVTSGRNFPQGEKVIGHVGIKFPDDSEYEKDLDLKIMAMEWVKGTEYFLVDCSNPKVQFIKAKPHNPNSNRQYMTRTEAKAALEHINKDTLANSPSLFGIIKTSGLWVSMEHEAEWSSTVSTPAPMP